MGSSNQTIDAPPPLGEGTLDAVLLERLTLYARRRVARVHGVRIEPAQDYVARAVMETMSGRRTRQLGVSMFVHLAGVVSSLVSHDAELAENRATIPWPETRTADGDLAPLDMVDLSPNAEETMVAREAAARQSRLAIRVLNALADAPHLRKAARMIMEAPGPIPPRRLAEALGCDVGEVYNMRKQLQRRLAFLNQPEETEESQ
jgi:hypothetical protein